jgi:hypothetical protein
VPVNCEDTCIIANRPAWPPSRSFPETVPRQIDLIGAPQLMSVEGPLAAQIDGSALRAHRTPVTVRVGQSSRGQDVPPASSMGRAEFRQQHGAPLLCGSPSVIVTQHRDQDAAVACELADAGHGGCRCSPHMVPGQACHGLGSRPALVVPAALMPRLRWWLGQELQQRRGESGRADIVPLTL